jgi:hypothetical protein
LEEEEEEWFQVPGFWFLVSGWKRKSGSRFEYIAVAIRIPAISILYLLQ